MEPTDDGVGGAFSSAGSDTVRPGMRSGTRLSLMTLEHSDRIVDEELEGKRLEAKHGQEGGHAVDEEKEAGL